MHMGDADTDQHHYDEQKKFWPKLQTNIAFPPYWFSISRSGQFVLQNVIQPEKVIGIHVPTKVPEELKQSGDDFFSTSGETREIRPIKVNK